MRVSSGLLMAGLVLLGGCAASTPNTVRQASAPPPAANQVLTPVITTADDPRITAQNRYAREMGYKLVTRHGVQFYCRKTTPIGSRLEQVECLTADGMAQAQAIADQNNNSWQESHQCLGAGCVIK
jgi:hypothetical protein